MGAVHLTQPTPGQMLIPNEPVNPPGALQIPAQTQQCPLSPQPAHNPHRASPTRKTRRRHHPHQTQPPNPDALHSHQPEHHPQIHAPQHQPRQASDGLSARRGRNTRQVPSRRLNHQPRPSQRAHRPQPAYSNEKKPRPHAGEQQLPGAGNLLRLFVADESVLRVELQIAGVSVRFRHGCVAGASSAPAFDHELSGG